MTQSWFQRLRGALRNEPAIGKDTNPRVAEVVQTTVRRKTLAPTDQLCAITDAGRVRDRNEDLAYVSADARLLIVADGMGGHATGEVASELAIAAVVERLGTLLPHLGNDDGSALGQAMLAAMGEAHARVLAAGRDQQRDDAMGCTMVIACIRGNTLVTCHVGDARAYLRSAQGFRKLTRDHSVVAELISAGELTADEAREHPAKNEVLQALGMPAGLAPDTNTCSLHDGDRVLLCSDGLWEMLSDQEIASVIGADGSMRQIAMQMVDRANDAGGSDNVSVVLYEHRAVR